MLSKVLASSIETIKNTFIKRSNEISKIEAIVKIGNQMINAQRQRNEFVHAQQLIEIQLQKQQMMTIYELKAKAYLQEQINRSSPYWIIHRKEKNDYVFVIRRKEISKAVETNYQELSGLEYNFTPNHNHAARELIDYFGEDLYDYFGRHIQLGNSRSLYISSMHLCLSAPIYEVNNQNNFEYNISIDLIDLYHVFPPLGPPFANT